MGSTATYGNIDTKLEEIKPEEDKPETAKRKREDEGEAKEKRQKGDDGKIKTEPETETEAKEDEDIKEESAEQEAETEEERAAAELAKVERFADQSHTRAFSSRLCILISVNLSAGNQTHLQRLLTKAMTTNVLHGGFATEKDWLWLEPLLRFSLAEEGDFRGLQNV